MKQNLFKNTLILGVASCAFGLLTACASLEDGDTFTEKHQSVKTTAVSQDVCTAENQGNCVVTYEEPDLNLNQTYAGYAMSTNSSYQAGSATVAMSAPGQINGLSVKDKVSQRTFAQQQADLALKPVQGGQIVCTGDACSEALFKTEIEKTIRTTVTENQNAQATSYVYAASAGQAVPAPVSNMVQPMIVLANGTVVPAETMVQTVGTTVQVAGGTVQGTVPTVGTTQVIGTTVPTGENAVQVVEYTGRSGGSDEMMSAPQEVMSTALTERVAFGQEVHDWEAPAGETLRHLLMQWGELSGWTVIWKLDRDYNLEAGVVFRGTFTEVAAAFIRSFARATPAPIGTFYQGNRVLVINTQESENAD